MDIIDERRNWNDAVAKARAVIDATAGLDAIRVQMSDALVERLQNSSPSHEMWTDDDEAEWRENADELRGAELPLTEEMLWAAIGGDATLGRNLAGNVRTLLSSTKAIRDRVEGSVEVELGDHPNLQGLLADEVAAIVDHHRRKTVSLSRSIYHLHWQVTALLAATTWVEEKRQRMRLLTRDILENRLSSPDSERIIGICERIHAASHPEAKTSLAVRTDMATPF